MAINPIGNKFLIPLQTSYIRLIKILPIFQKNTLFT